MTQALYYITALEFKGAAARLGKRRFMMAFQSDLKPHTTKQDYIIPDLLISSSDCMWKAISNQNEQLFRQLSWQSFKENIAGHTQHAHISPGQVTDLHGFSPPPTL